MTKLAGLTKLECANGCDENACLIGGRPRCMHPNKGGIPIELLNDLTVHAAYDEACALLSVRNIHRTEQKAS